MHNFDSVRTRKHSQFKEGGVSFCQQSTQFMCVCVCVCVWQEKWTISGGDKLTPYYLSMASSAFFPPSSCPVHFPQFYIWLSSLLPFRQWEGRRRGVLMSKYESQGLCILMRDHLLKTALKLSLICSSHGYNIPIFYVSAIHLLIKYFTCNIWEKQAARICPNVTCAMENTPYVVFIYAYIVHTFISF